MNGARQGLRKLRGRAHIGANRLKALAHINGQQRLVFDNQD